MMLELIRLFAEKLKDCRKAPGFAKDAIDSLRLTTTGRVRLALYNLLETGEVVIVEKGDDAFVLRGRTS